jgi:hypothetical protein
LGGFSSCWGKTIGNFLVFLGVNFAIFFGKIRPQTLKTTKLEKKKKKIEKEKKKNPCSEKKNHQHFFLMKIIEQKKK